MGTVTERILSTGVKKYRAQVRVKRQDLPNFTESKTFSTRKLAEVWIKKREYELETNPELMISANISKGMALAEALEKYLKENVDFGRSKRMGMRYLTNWPIGRVKISELTRKDFTDHTYLRRSGYPEIAADPIESSTALQDLQYLKVVLTHADLVWGEKVNLFELEQAMKGLRNARVITKSKKRDRLATSNELQLLTNYFYRRWKTSKTSMPLHLIMWLAIYTCRREDELTRLFLDEYDRHHHEWKVFDLKNPNGSAGNHKSFLVTEKAELVVQEIMKSDVRDRMLRLDSANPSVLLPLNAKSFAARWREAIKMTGIDDLRFHDLRHEGITRLAEDGLTIPQMQQVSLHESWESLRRYVNLKNRRERLDFKDAMQIAKAGYES
ncbi:tyrosine-type recombinase/integrase [Acinetobacter celticus]|uniref:Integrase n=1 Tax=Acinetobacter celticus TaxID=1891224 RepID=A0A1C3CUT8_9GAMM|nr:tyrosine-type recombinase/integrase [Acinetobacter celticus]ODA12491.1 integrase [Acinetobacter celticus]